MTISLSGKNHFLLQRRLDQLVSNFLKKESELALEKIDGAEADFTRLSDAVQSMPFLAANKMVVVRQLSANKEAVDNIEQLIYSVSSSTELIIVEPNIDKRTAYFKVLKDQTVHEEFNELDPNQLADWVSREVKNRGGEINLRDANYLVERLGANQMMLASELDKLLTHKPQITKETIDLLTDKNPQSKIFDLLDAMFGGHKEKALELYEEQRMQKVEPQAILALITWQLQLLAFAKFGEGRTSAQIAKETKMSPYPIAKAQNLVRKISKTKLQEMIDQALIVDYRSKTEAIDINEALKNYILTL